MTRHLLIVVLVALLATACNAPSSASTDQPATTSATDPDDPSAPTGGSLAANEGFLVVPDGYEDCGASILSSGSPTTTVFDPEVELTCLNEAIESNTPSQYAYWGRDEAGSITGTIIRVNASQPFTLIDYTVDSAGNVDSSVYECFELESDDDQLPVCVLPDEAVNRGGGPSEPTQPRSGDSRPPRSGSRGGG
jgi:hypothetical protein